MRIVCVTIDSHDPAALAEFWNAALRWGGVTAAPDGGGCGAGRAAHEQAFETHEVARHQKALLVVDADDLEASGGDSVSSSSRSR